MECHKGIEPCNHRIIANNTLGFAIFSARMLWLVWSLQDAIPIFGWVFMGGGSPRKGGNWGRLKIPRQA